MNCKIEKLDHSDIQKFIALIRVFEDVFEMKDFRIPDELHLRQLLRKEDFFVFVAFLDDKVIGGLTSYILHQYYSPRPLVYIFDLAVVTEHQWKGIGKRLIARNNDYCRSIGAEVVMVQADVADDYAIKFYKSTGGKPEEVIHFDYQISDRAE